MITADLFKKDETIVTIGDYKQECPKGKRSFYSFVTFDDFSTVHWTNFFATNRTEALKQVMERFADCSEYVASINLHGDD